MFMKKTFVRYTVYLVTVGLLYGFFRISDFNPLQSKSLALVSVLLGVGIMEVSAKKSHRS